jgi:uncharacterized protein (DUF4415 family)
MTTADRTKAMLIDGVLTVKKSDGSSRPRKGASVGRTDWARLKALPEADIEAAMQADSDNPPMDDETWAKAISVPAKSYIHIGIDEDVLGWFKNHGRGYQTRINAVLRRYVEAQRKVG